MKIKILLAMALPLLGTACGNEEGGGEEPGQVVPVTFQAVIQPESVARVTVNNGWSGLEDNRVAVAVDGAVKVYTVDEAGNMTAADPFYWEEKESLTADAWYPYADGVKPQSVTVSADQSVEGNYVKSDFLEVVAATVKVGKPRLEFTHRTARLACSLEAEYSTTDNAQVVFHNLTGVDEGTSVRATSRLQALVAPQTVVAGTEFIEVSFGEGGHYVYTLEDDLELKGGTQYNVSIIIAGKGGEIEVSITESPSWTSDEETVNGGAPATNPDSGNGNWTGGSEDADGNSPGTNPDSGNGSWNGGEEDTGGTSPGTNPGSGNGNWTGGSEDAGGNSPTTNPDSGNGSWSGGEENADGTSPSGTPGAGNGTWTGNGENTGGTSPGATTGNTGGGWTGDNETANGDTPGTDTGTANGGTWTEDKENAPGGSPGASTGSSDGTWSKGDSENVTAEDKADTGNADTQG